MKRHSPNATLLYHPRSHIRIWHKTLLIFPENPVAIARDETVDGVAERLWYRAQHAHPAPARQRAEHGQRGVGFAVGDAAMDDGIGVGIGGVDAKSLRQTCAVGRLDRGEAETAVDIARRDEADPARAKHAETVVEDHVVVGPRACHAPHRLAAAAGRAPLSARSR